MVTVKFTAEKANKRLIIIPTIAVDYSGTSEIELLCGWLTGALFISISWTSRK